MIVPLSPAVMESIAVYNDLVPLMLGTRNISFFFIAFFGADTRTPT